MIIKTQTMIGMLLSSTMVGDEHTPPRRSKRNAEGVDIDLVGDTTTFWGRL